MTHIPWSACGAKAVCPRSLRPLPLSIRVTPAAPLALSFGRSSGAQQPRGCRVSCCCSRLTGSLPSQPAPISSSSASRCPPQQSAAAQGIAVGGSSSEAVSPILPLPRSGSSLPARALFGSLLGLTGALIILTGGWVFTAATSLVVYQVCQEFQGFLTSKGISEGMPPPPPLVSNVASLLCVCLCVWTHVSNGKSTAALAVASFTVLSLQLFAIEKPQFSQMTSSVFGLFYCGYLPSFWVKLRLLGVPAVHSSIVHSWPVALGGLSHWTVGLIATIMSVACIIAADTGAYFTGKKFGRTQLISISPKKTVEGALGGLACSILVALAFWRAFHWPLNPFIACSLGMVIFTASLFGDLLESVMKRNAGMKDASKLIPGHGGLLDRFDSYMFTGAIVYFKIKFVLPLFGV